MKSTVESFLTAAEEQQIIGAIRSAELKTSGEIRVHLEHHTELPPLDRAREVFHLLKMDNTKEENGVLIYVAVDDHLLAIIGDSGINKAVPEDFWQNTIDRMLAFFKKDQFTDGLVLGVKEAGQKLSTYFPWEHGNKNELSDEISIG